MQTYDLRALAKWNEERFQSVPVFREPHQRALLLCMKRGQKVPEHKADGLVTVLPIDGRIIFTENGTPAEVPNGTMIRLELNASHALEALDDSLVLVTITKVAS